MASVEPRIIVRAAIAQSAGRRSQETGPRAVVNTLRSAANAATFVPAAMNAVTGVGAPWYTSGVHIWNGTAATLNPNPTTSSPPAMRARARVDPASPDRALAMAPIDVV